MSKLVLLQGLVASGKTTRARVLHEEYAPNAVRLNRDELRAMLHAGPWTEKQEGITRDVARALAKHLLAEMPMTGVVIVDDTNLDPRTVESWKTLAKEHDATLEIVRLDTPLAECLRRDTARAKPAGRSVVIGMALQYGLYPKPEKGFVLCDLDGTLANIDHRWHFVQQEPKDWQAFFEAMPADTVCSVVLETLEIAYKQGHAVFFVTGRPDTYRVQTEVWLEDICSWQEPVVFMRRGGDHRSDIVVKEEMLMRYFPDVSWIETAIDDRPSVIDQVWLRHGISVIDHRWCWQCRRWKGVIIADRSTQLGFS